jgi:uncharacterized protein (TIGR02001 family)
MKGTAMKSIKGLLLGIGVAALLSSSALAADVLVRKAPAAAPAPATPLWDLAFGAALMSDYNFRGVSQSNREISFGAYAELQFNPANAGQFYAGLAAWRVNWPSDPAYGFTNPAAEVDITGGWRNKWGAFALDLGFIYYYYPNEVFNGFTNNSDFWEFAVKAAYDVTPDLTIGVNVFYTPDLLNYSQSFAAAPFFVSAKASATYASLTAKWVTPWKSGDFGSYISGELGHWWIASSGFIATGYVDPSYSYANVGLAVTWKTLTLDFRVHGNDMNVATCTSFLWSAVGNPSNKWCGTAYIVALKWDTSFSALTAK